MKRKINISQKAFTLAETLIVIGVIGIVAALTLPNLNSSTGDKETVTRVKKIQATLMEANDRAVAVYGPVSEWKSDILSMTWPDRVSEFLKLSKDCTDNTNNACANMLKGDLDYNGGRVLAFADGATMYIEGDEYYSECNGSNGFDSYLTKDICMPYIKIDINGPNKGKNKYGHDIFVYAMSDSKGILPMMSSSLEGQLEDCFNSGWLGCTWWVLEYGNLDYLKVDSNGKCPDGKTVLDGVTTISCN